MDTCNQDWTVKVNSALSQKMRTMALRNSGRIPYTVENGAYDDQTENICWWCNGFWGGMQALMLIRENGDEYLANLREIEGKLDGSFSRFMGIHHDVGFMFIPTAVADYRITGNPGSRVRALHAATLLAGRYNPAGRFIRAWNNFSKGSEDNRGWAIIDCMFNLGLLYWASEDTGDPRFSQIAQNHADTTMNYFVRPDGSVRHIVEFNPVDGSFVKDYGGQGCREGSSWTRGQAWGLYGFTISYRHTGRKDFLRTAVRIADSFISRIPDSGLVPVDFDQPEEPVYFDDSAAAVSASGLLDLHEMTGDARYREAAMRMLKALFDSGHLDLSEERDGLLMYCSKAYHSVEHNRNIIYGDYFFLEAMLKLEGMTWHMW